MVREGEGLGLEMPGPVQSREAAVPGLPALETSRLWKDEWEIMGFTCREHPLAALRDDLQKSGVAFSTEIPKNDGRFIRLAGVIAAGRRINTEGGELMQFLTFDDETGVFEVVLFPNVYRKTRFLLDGPGPYIVEGRVENQYGALTVTASRLEVF
jgi:DNA polymerase III alpha subunit